MMARFLLLLAMLFCLNAGATTAVLQLSDARLNTSIATNRTIWLQRMSVPDGVNNTTVIIGDKIISTTDTNGSVTYTNIQAGLYAVTVRAPPTQTQFQFLVQATNLGTIYVADCLVASSTATFPAGAVAWAASVTDGRYARTTNSLTNNFITGAQLTNTLLGYQPATSNLTNWSALSTNLLVTSTTWLAGSNTLRSLSLTIGSEGTNYTKAAGLATTNYARDVIGLALTNKANQVGSDATNYTQAAGLAATNFIVATSNSIRGLGIWQPASTTLTNWGLHNTNAFQSSSVNLSNFSTLSTNLFYTRNNESNFVTASITNGLASTNYVNTISNNISSMLNQLQVFGSSTSPNGVTVVSNAALLVITNGAAQGTLYFHGAGTNSVWITIIGH